MARRTGKDGNVLLGAGPTAIPALREWSYREGTRSVDATAAGDSVDDTEALRMNFEFSFRALLEIAVPYVMPWQAIRGTKAAFVGELVAADTAGLVSGTGLVEEIQVTVPYDGMVEVTGRIVSGGTAVTWDTTPA